MYIKRLISGSIHLIFPPCCSLCKLSDTDFYNSVLCLSCWKTIYHPLFTLQAIDTSWAYFLSASKYQTLTKKTIQSAKFFADSVCFSITRDLLRNAFSNYVLTDYDFITYVPPVPSRIRKRKFDLCFFLAKDLSRVKKVPFSSELIIRKKSPPQQTSLAKKKRLTNVKDAFSASKNVRGKKIIVVDDITTTGATAQAVLSSLYAQGATSLLWISIARTPPKK